MICYINKGIDELKYTFYSFIRLTHNPPKVTSLYETTKISIIKKMNYHKLFHNYFEDNHSLNKKNKNDVIVYHPRILENSSDREIMHKKIEQELETISKDLINVNNNNKDYDSRLKNIIISMYDDTSFQKIKGNQKRLC